MEHIKTAFTKCAQQKRAALVAYVTAGYPKIEETVDILLGLENGGAGIQTQSFVYPLLGLDSFPHQLIN
jgi:tryptophan synthase alpha subunit